jgi:uncharacterized protein (DUF1499 family)
MPNGQTAPGPTPRVPRWAWWVLALSGAAAVLPMAAGLGSRFGLWHFRTGFVLLRIDVYLCGAALVVAAVAFGISLVRRFRGALPVALAALLIPMFPLAAIMAQARDARHLPRIHDITTDFAEPPQYSAVIPLRPPGSNSLKYEGPSVAASQAAAYPDIQPILSRRKPDRAFELARELAHAYGWKIVREDREAGEMEAVDTTFWFGFKDDISIRIRPHPGGSRVDIRSVSRVGVSDVGTNARRIRRFMHDFKGG